MEMLKDPRTRITTVILLLLLAVLIHVAFLPLTGAVATLHYNATSGCPGDPLFFICLAFGTDILKWTVNTQQIGFRSNSNVSDRESHTVDGAAIVASLTSKSCHSERNCSMESLLHVVIPDMRNLTLLCQSANNDSEIIIITINDQCNISEDPTMNPVTTPEVPGAMNPVVTKPPGNSSGLLIQASSVTPFLMFSLSQMIIIYY